MDNKENPVRILVIDDDDVSREVLALLLEKEGYAAETASSGEAALLRLQQPAASLPQIILADMQMPGISGTELAQQLRSLNTGITLLAMSAGRPERTGLNGFDNFLLKPFTMQTLKDAIARNTASNNDEQLQTTDVLNEAVYTKLANSMSATQLEQLYAMCLEDTEKRITRMRRAALEEDDATYRREAHGIKGGSGMVGATQLQRLATSMEEHGLNDNHVATLDEFVAACERLHRILNARADRKS